MAVSECRFVCVAALRRARPVVRIIFLWHLDLSRLPRCWLGRGRHGVWLPDRSGVGDRRRAARGLLWRSARLSVRHPLAHQEP
jgi:hypothetical protein